MTKDLRLVSIGLPVYNESAHLADCVNCVLQQSYANIEICISDNASTDGTYELAKKISADHNNIKVRRHEHNLGPGPNFDSVRSMSNGHYFMWLSGDDRIDPTYVEKMVQELDSHPAAVVAHSATLRIAGAGQILNEVRYSGRYNPNTHGLLRQALNVLTSFKTARERKLGLYVYGLYRKAVLDDIFESVSNPLYFGDRVLPALAAASGGQRYVDEFLFHKRVHDLSHGKRNPDDTTFTVRDQNRKISNLVLWFAKCRTIPFWRRWYGLVIALPFVFDRFQNWLKAAGMQPLVRTKFKF